jgi:uncharacterized secreted protein with C-terminal beta-propeller domain
MAWRSDWHRFSLPSLSRASVTGRARAHQARPAQRRRRAFQFERLEDRLTMAGDAAALALRTLEADLAFTVREMPIGNVMVDSLRTTRMEVDYAENSDVFLDYLYSYGSGYDYLEVDWNRQAVPLDVLANDFPYAPNLDPTIISVEQPLAGGTLAIAEDGKSLLFTATPGFIGTATATYTARFGAGEDEVQRTSVTLVVRRPFLPVDDWFAVDPAEGPATLDVLANEKILYTATNLNGPPRDLRIVGVAAGEQRGRVTIAEDGKSLIYEAAAGFSGDERIAYEVEDQFGNRDQAELFVHVAAKSTSNISAYHPEELRVRLLQMAAERWGGLFGVTQSLPVQFNGGPIVCWGCDASGNPQIVNYLELSGDATREIDVRGFDLSDTNAQVAGVDEADLVETDGRFLYTLSKGRLTIVDVANPSALRLVSVTELTTSATALFLDDGRLTIVGNASAAGRSSVLVFDLTDPAAPRMVQHTEVDGRLTASRSIDGRVYLVVQEGLIVPAIETITTTLEDGTTSTRYETWEEYVARMRSGAWTDTLPEFQSFDEEGNVIASGALTEPGEISRPLFGQDQLVSVVAIDMHSDVPGIAAAETWCDRELATDSVYVNHDSFYIWSIEGGGAATQIRKLHIGDPASIDLVATGRVLGRPVDQFSLDEHDGNLRVVTTTETRVRGRLTAEVNDLYVLEEVDGELKIVGQVSDFASGESVRSVRFDGTRAHVVTFPDEVFEVQAFPFDPLYVIDLSDPTAPTIEGELVVPGYSTYLEMIGEDQLLGFGADIDPVTGANRGVLLSLFGTHGFEEPTILDQFRFELDEVESSIALDDHRAIAYYAEEQIVTVPVTWSELVEGSIGVQRQRSELWVLKIDSETGKFELVTRVNHDSPALRSVRVGDVLLTISDTDVTSHVLSEPTTEADRLYLGDLPQVDQYTKFEDTGPWTLDVLANDRLDDDGEQSTIVSVTQPGSTWNWSLTDFGTLELGMSMGSVAIAEDGKSLVFTPTENFYGSVSFTYTVFDEVRGLQTATVFIAIERVADDLVAGDDTFDVEPGAQGVPLHVLGNDVDPDVITSGFSLAHLARLQLTNYQVGYDVVTSSVVQLDDPNDPYFFVNGIRITAVSAADHGGTVEIDAYGRFLNYTPAEGFEGAETFTYTIETADGRTDTATVSIHVGPVETTIMTVALPEVAPQEQSAPSQEISLLQEQSPLHENAPAEWTAAETAATGVALPVVDVAPLFVTRPAAAIGSDRVLFAARPAAIAASSSLLNLSRRPRMASVGLATDEAFAELVGWSGDRGADLPDDLALALAGRTLDFALSAVDN